MQTIDSGFCGNSSATGQASATQGSTGFRGSFQDRADQLVRATVLSDLGQSGGHGRHSHGIEGVVAAISKVLSGQDVTGTDAADDVLKKIETSLHKAAQKLADRGVDAKTIDATIDRFRAQLANALDGTSAAGAGSANGSSTGTTPGSGASGTGSGGTGAPPKTPSPVPLAPSGVSKFVSREVRKERGAIDLVTAEGDRVSIRFRTKDVVTNSARETTASDGTTTTAAKSSVSSRGGLKIEVDGDLNEDELKAIGDLLGKVDDIATQFFSGDVQAAFNAADSLGVDSDQIAGYQLNLTYSRKVSAAYAGASLPASTQSSAAGGAATAGDSASAGSAGSASGANGSSSAPASSTGSDSASPPTNSASNSASGNGISSGSTASNAGSAATDSTPTSGTSDTPPATTPPASAQKTLINFISDALSKLSSANGAGRLSFSTHWKMSVLVTAIQSAQPAQPTTAADQATANNTQLFGDSLQKIASA